MAMVDKQKRYNTVIYELSRLQTLKRAVGISKSYEKHTEIHLINETLLNMIREYQAEARILKEEINNA